MSADSVPRQDTSVVAAISCAAGRIIADHTGRGPTKVRTTLREDVVLIMLNDLLSRSEQKLVDAGERDFVLQLRHRFQGTMRDDLIAVVEAETRRKVIAFMSANHLNPDLGAEIFVLEPIDATDVG